MLSRYQRNRDLINVGAYSAGRDALLDRAIALYPRIEGIFAAGFPGAGRVRAESRDARRTVRPRRMSGMSRQHFPIKTLIELAQEEIDAAAKKAGPGPAPTRTDGENQLNTLIKYRDDYYAQLHAVRAGRDAGGQLAQFPGVHRHARRRDRTAARRVFAAANARVEAAKPEWRRQKQKLGSYEVLQARGEAAEAKKAARGEQRETDEYAARTLLLRTGSTE